MLSAKVGELCAQILRLNKQLDELILEETAGKYGMCKIDTIQLWADPSMHHDLQELEKFVGNVHSTYRAPDKTEHYTFTLGGAPCLIIMPAGTSDSRCGPDEVRTEEETC